MFLFKIYLESTLMNNLFYIYFFILENRILLNICFALLTGINSFYFTDFSLYINNYSDIPLNESDTNYLPYNPDLIETSQGYRVELYGNNNSDLIETSQGYRVEIGENTDPNEVNHIDRPSHYRPLHYKDGQSTQLGEIRSNASSTQLGEIEPNESQLNNEGIFWGNQVNPTSSTKNSNFLSSMKKKISVYAGRNKLLNYPYDWGYMDLKKQLDKNLYYEIKEFNEIFIDITIHLQVIDVIYK